MISEYRHADRKPERLEGLAHDLVLRKVDVIVAMQTVSAHAAKKASRDIPIVFATSDAKGLVDNLARPEGNLTGVSNIGAAIAGKQLQVVKEMVPKASRAVALANPENPRRGCLRKTSRRQRTHWACAWRLWQNAVRARLIGLCARWRHAPTSS
ncbi:MAG TPA: ABC transporter substrate binding protein [Casimicrobiaceae bacterium]|nr:ABC transporter substrate binding protein [Casimicrobiaceae bacterium]